MSTMRGRRWACSSWHWTLLSVALVVNVLMLLYIASVQDKLSRLQSRDVPQYFQDCPELPNNDQIFPEYFADGITFILRDFEDFENDIPKIVVKLLRVIEFSGSNHQILIIADTLPYPPLVLPESRRVRLVHLDTTPERDYMQSKPYHFIHTGYIVYFPDATILNYDSKILDYMLSFYDKLGASDTIGRMAAWPVDREDSAECLGLNVKLKQWTLQYSPPTLSCDAVHGKFLLLISKEDLFKLADPFRKPIQVSLFLQTALRGWKVALDQKVIAHSTKELFEDAHSNWKQQRKEESYTHDVYRDFGIKLVKQKDGQEDWHGCSKQTERCFGTILQEMPDYIYKGRWTPPCCLNALRITARHVFRLLESQGVRYWLEGGSLLGAARHQDIIPWDYDVDIGIYRDDITKSYHLMNCDNGAHQDEDGFVWERAPEGEFYRVQYSQTNRLHVDIYPFFSRNGTMTKNTWFKSHRQDTEFPEHFLQPLTKINFVGMEASAPNNWKQFMEFKFGKGVVENPKYPDSSNVM